MDLRAPRQEHRRDDQHLQRQPRQVGGELRDRLHGPDRIAPLERRHREIPVPREDHRRRHVAQALRGDGLHTRGGRPRHAVRVVRGGLQDELPVLPDGQAGIPRLSHRGRHSEPGLQHTRGRQPDQHRIHGARRADGQPRQRVALHANTHRALRLGLEPETHHRELGGTERQAAKVSQRERLPGGDKPPLAHTRAAREVDAGREGHGHKRRGRPIARLRLLAPASPHVRVYRVWRPQRQPNPRPRDLPVAEGARLPCQPDTLPSDSQRASARREPGAHGDFPRLSHRPRLLLHHQGEPWPGHRGGVRLAEHETPTG